MANVHIQSAATNIRQAINDLKNLQQEIKSTIDHQVHDQQQQQNSIKAQEAALKVEIMRLSDQNSLSQQRALLQHLGKEQSEISKHIDEMRGEADKQLRNIDNQIAHYESMARQLEMSA